ncbi:hypothetical protein [Clostridium saccharobutylicum]|uniref:Transmembrane protein n=1 Tax=Clostridium saccharobutylicum TaxID=169679 RepID=A0A1S8N3Y8_CLOSA|nr:hypothetical protein [Clostridium saccharobutylicum]OOM11123.1 hypothetical protein CLOSAC_26660 [Clostridium saccharobutylicum]
MAHNKLYRNFIILQEDERGYSSSKDKALSGYAKIEVKGDKCKVSFYAQNLRNEDDYSMVLICCKRDFKQLVDLGPLTVNEVGKGDTSKEYYINNIAGLGISYEKISGAAICKTKGGENKFIMHGFMNGEESADNWTKYKIVGVDYKKYNNKLEPNLKPKEKVSTSLDTNDKVITVEPSKELAAPEKIIKAENNVIDKVETKIESKVNIKTECLNESISNSKDNNNLENVIVKRGEEPTVITEERDKIKENIIELDEDRSKCNKCGEKEKDHKVYDKDNKACLEEKKEHDKEHKMHSEKEHKAYDEKCHKTYGEKENKKMCVGEVIEAIADKLETYDGSINLEIKGHDKEVVIYGFIKDKKSSECGWKKFKIEKKCRLDDEDIFIEQNSKRIEENIRLDKIDFEEYENEIKKSNQANNNYFKKITPQSNTEVKTTTPESNTEVEKITPQTTTEVKESTPETTTEVKESTPQMTTEVKESTPEYNFEIKGKVGQYFEKLAEGFELLKNKLNDINYCKWYKVIVNKMEDLFDESDYNKYTLAYYPMLNYYPYISKDKHFLLGYKCDKNGELKYIVYAIPGSKDKCDQPYGGKTGFVTWTSNDSMDKGYWLMFYDYKSSSIVVPMK